MPSWSHSLSQEHQWTGRKLIGDDDLSEDEDDSGGEEDPSEAGSMDMESTLDKRHITDEEPGQSSDDEKQTISHVDQEGLATRFHHQNPFRNPTQESQESVGNTSFLKRTLLTTEEMEDSDGYAEEWEDGDVSEGGPINESWSSGRISPASGYQQQIRQTDGKRWKTFNLNEQNEMANDSNSGCAGSSTILDAQRDPDEREPPISSIDSGRVENAALTPKGPSSSQALASKRRKKAIKYLEHVILDLLRQIVAITKIQLQEVRSEIGEGDGSESESENEELEESGLERPTTLNEANVTADEEGKGVSNVCIPLLNRATGNLKYLKYPGKPGQSDTTALSLARLLRVCELLHHALVEDIIVTKRDIYYKDVNLFGKQSVVDALIDDVVASIGLKRMDFNVVASPKGLVASSGLILLMKNDEKKTLSATPSIIPSNGEIIEIQSARPPRWALVIEKEATFTTLCKSGILADEELADGLLITGKGYPDLATLHFLKLLSESFPECLIGILVDADPHGLDILSVYRYGSKKMRYTAEAEGLALGAKAVWMGVMATEWSHLLKAYSWHQAESMLQEDDLPMDWKLVTLRTLPNRNQTLRRELVHMLHMRRKAEIQILGGIAATGRSAGNDFAESQAEPRPSPRSTQESVAKSRSLQNEGVGQEPDRIVRAIPEERTESVESSGDTRSSEGRDRLYDYVKAKLCKMLYKLPETEEKMDVGFSD
ncbi:hypothetical protein QFC21_006031 [Naganishia friedmannii]|uniref:Uncharacterized protein n=1 Tax=Naganishia friedmannii TaxID=89922 RepID=A0ACC2V5F5_9TREE|nr:hypothetical protein QFC21_006031 [Naganishia friedmannii]